jgi:hypothetical protein
MRRYKVTYRRRKTKSVRTDVVMSQCIGKTAAFNDCASQANAKVPGDDWSYELLEIDTDAYRVETHKRDSVERLVLIEDGKAATFRGEIADVDMATYLPLLAKRISELEIEVRS